MIKKLILSIGAATMMLAAVTSHAQTTNTQSGVASFLSSIKNAGVLQATNYAFEPYVTYAPDLKDKVGGGILAVYNFNSFVGVGAGVDYLGQFSLVSGNVTLKLPIKVGEQIGKVFPSWTAVTNIVVTPFVLGGIGMPLSGASGNVSTIEDLGGYIQFGKLWGGKFNVGACWGQWNNAGPDYSGKRYHGFVGWSRGF